MKAMILAILTFSSITALADITVITSQLNGRALELPGGLLQILNPTITIDSREWELATGADTAIGACKLIGKSYVNFDAANQTKPAIFFRPDGSMGVYGTRTGYKLSMITCK